MMALSGATARSKRPTPAASSSNVVRLMVERKSTSSCIPSTERGASRFAERISFVLRTCLRSFAIALGASETETLGLCLASNSAAKWSTRSMSMSSPPQLSSHFTAFTSNCPWVFFLPASLASKVL